MNSVEELDELLSRPSDADVEAMAALDGDLLVLGAGGKMGPSLAVRAHRAIEKSGKPNRVIAVARFNSVSARHYLDAAGVDTVAADLLDPSALHDLPMSPNVIFMAARKFGTTGAEYLTWALNTYLPALIADRFRASRIVAFSTGNVYPLVPVSQGGATESTQPAPVGEYAQSALGRERMFEYASHRFGTPVAILRLNYAIDLRYGVLVDIGRKVFERRPVNVSMGMVNVIWQGDSNSICLRSIAYCKSPPLVLNVTGPAALSVRYIASEFGRRFGVEPAFEGEEADTALLSNSAKAQQLFGYPTVAAGEMIDWIAHWIQIGGESFDKPTHYEVRDGRF